MNAREEPGVSTAAISTPSRIARIIAFACETHPPLTYLLVSVGWSFSLLVLLEWAYGAINIPARVFVLPVIFFLILLYLRAVDEVKDLDYDRLHNPDRPLVRGAISIREVWLLAAAVGSIVIVACALLSPPLALLALFEMLYAIDLLNIERRSRVFRDTILLNLCVTFPVSAMLNLYVVIYLAESGIAPAWPQILAIVAAHMCIFLHLEFGRKLKKPQLSDAAENGYALVLGVKGAMAVCALFGIVACALASWQLWLGGAGYLSALPWLALGLSVFGLVRFAGAHDHTPKLKPLFGGAMIVFFFLNITAVLCANAHPG